MTSLNESMADGNTMDKIQFNDGHLDTIFAFVGIALASISGNILNALTFDYMLQKRLKKLKLRHTVSK